MVLPPVTTPVLLPESAAVDDDFPPWAAATAPPAAAPPTSATIAIHFELLDFAAGSALVCMRLVRASSPRQEEETRIRNCPATRLGFNPLPAAIPRVSACTVRLSPLSPKVPLAPLAGSRNVTVAPAAGLPEASNTCTEGSCPRCMRMLLMAPSPSSTRILPAEVLVGVGVCATAARSTIVRNATEHRDDQ